MKPTIKYKSKDGRYSILYPLDKCYVCNTELDVHIHEVFYGTANRQKSIEYGCCVGLCGRHHNLSSKGVHFNKKLDMELKCAYQKQFILLYGQEKWDEVFHHRSYL